MFSRILIPLDGSPLAERALPHAVQLAHIFQSKLLLLQVLEAEPSNRLIEPLSWQIRKAEGDLYLRKWARLLTEQGLEVDYQLLEGRTPEAIVQYARSANADLLVIGSHGRSGLSGWNINSVVGKVLEKIYLPVLLVRAYQAVETGESPIRYRTLVLPFDCSKRAECSLQVGIAIAAASEADLHLVHVLRKPDVLASVPQSAELNRLADEFMVLSRAANLAYLDELSQRIPVSSTVTVVEGDSVTRAIHELAEQKAADLLIFCAHGHTGLATWPYGSVVRDYIEHGTRPVLVMQDIPPTLVKLTQAEIAAQQLGTRG